MSTLKAKVERWKKHDWSKTRNVDRDRMRTSSMSDRIAYLEEQVKELSELVENQRIDFEAMKAANFRRDFQE